MGIIDRLFGDKKNTVPNVAEFDISNTHFFSIGDVPDIDNPVMNEKYSCRFIKKVDNTLRFAVCVKNGVGFSYDENDVIAVSYVEFRELHMFMGRIAYIDDVRHSDHIEIDVFKEHTTHIGNCSLIAVNVYPLNYPEKQQRREYFRIPALWSVYFKISNLADDNFYTDDNKDEQDDTPSARFSDRQALVQKLLIASGAFEMEGDYFKIRTVDISAGGFKSKIGVKIPVGSNIECAIIMGGEHSGKIATDGVIVGCEPDLRDKGFYFMRVKFKEMHPDARSAIIKCIFDLERKMTQNQRRK